MKALSLTQPWASLVAWEAKRFETRSWTTTYRGPIAIHASKGMPRWAVDCCDQPSFLSVCREHVPSELIRQPASRWFPRGVVIATARLVDVLPIEAVPGTARCVAPDDEGLIRRWSGWQRHPGMGSSGLNGGDSHAAEYEREFGDYTPGRFAWMLDDVHVLPEPVPAKGKLGLWDWKG
jgi:activating signal cointegrator 1